MAPPSGVRAAARAPGLPVAAQLDLAPGRTPAWPSRLFANLVAAGVAQALSLQQLDGGLFGAGLVLPADAGEGSCRLTLEPYAGLDGGSVDVVLDRTAPTFVAAIEGAPVRTDVGNLTLRDPALPSLENAFRRDETMDVAVSTTDLDVEDAGVGVEVEGVLADGGLAPPSALGVSTNTGTCRASCGTGVCRCFTVDLSKPLLDAALGQFSLVVSVTDTAGNTRGPDPVGSRYVTRWKWKRALATAETIESAPAVGAQGRLYFGHQTGLAAWGPDGQQLWNVSVGPVRSSVAVAVDDGGTERVFVASATGELQQYLAGDGGTRPPCGAATFGAGAAPALGFTSAAGEVALTAAAVFAPAGSDPGWVALRPGAANAACTFGPHAGLDVPWPGNAVVSDAGFLASANTAGLVRLEFDGASWSMPAGVPTGISAPRVLSLDTAGHVALTGGGSGVAGTALPVGFGASSPLLSASTAGAPVVASPGVYWAGTAASELRRFGAGATPLTVPLSAALLASPVLGAGGLLYLADSGGEVEARSTADASPRWRRALSEGIAASPALDVSRDASGNKLCAKPGVLYVATLSGSVYALLVDSPGLDPSAPWPKYQHDPRNTGNADWPSVEFTCP